MLFLSYPTTLAPNGIRDRRAISHPKKKFHIRLIKNENLPSLKVVPNHCTVFHTPCSIFFICHISKIGLHYSGDSVMGNQNIRFFLRLFLYIIQKVIDSLCQTKRRFSSFMAAGKELFRFLKVLSIPGRGFPFAEVLLDQSRLYPIPVISEISCAVSFARLSGEQRISSAWIPSARIFLPVSLACSRPYSVSGLSVQPQILFSTFHTVCP